MVTYYVKKGDVYKVTATANCAIYDANGSTIATCDAGQTVEFTAPTAKISLSNNYAAFKRSVENSSTVAGVSEHIADGSLHVSPMEKANWNASVDVITQKFPAVDSHIADSNLHITSEERQQLATVVNLTSLISGDESDLELHTSNSDIHVTAGEKQVWNNAAPKNYGTPNAVLITDADGNVVASTVITVAELNTLNNNTLNLKTKLADLESRLAALETA